MENKQEEILANYQMHTAKGNRLAIFGKNCKEGVEIFILEASKHDQFSKQIAKDVYKAFKDPKYAKFWSIDTNYYHPHTEIIKIKEGDSYKYTFDQYCKNYYKKGTTIVKYQVETIYKEGETLILKNGKRTILNKLG